MDDFRPSLLNSNTPRAPGADGPNPNAARRTGVLLALLAFVLVFTVWRVADNTSPLLYPFRLLVTFVHESGHGLSAILTGGRFLDFDIQPNGAGVAATAGGNRFVVLQMGYLGAALFGAFLLYATNRTSRTRWVAFAVGVYFIGCALLFAGGGTAFLAGAVLALALWLLAPRMGVRARYFQIGAGLVLLAVLALTGLTNTALLVGVIAGALLIALGAFAPRSVSVFVLNLVALLVSFNAVADILGLFQYPTIISAGGLPNDALAVAQLTNTPVQAWLIMWMVAVGGMLIAAIYFAFLRPARR
ncbi:MAG: M50 family metallopeptidase [Anaerolineae bacterium]|nr:M50 family metallopeptidase [Anaerolineae bacterium]